MKMSADKLRQFVFKDILSFRTHYIAQRIIEVQQEIARNPTNRELLQEFMKLQQINTLLARQANNILNKKKILIYEEEICNEVLEI